ncbi:MAG TPA: hypothetical protein VMT55_04515 [Candidatus Sulfotelmatobacter sp.]|nr:hypothetical protein [Candidatus Sulfotelmatobacter sp.]
MDNAKVIETLEKCTLQNYFVRLLNAKMHRLELFTVFPLTAAANLSDPRNLIIIDDPACFLNLNGGQVRN